MSASKPPERRTREAQYQPIADDVRSAGEERLGIQSSHSWRNDPKHLLFHLSRYKFVSKMFAGRRHVLEAGCGDALGTRIVRQAVQSLTATDFDPLLSVLEGHFHNVFMFSMNDEVVHTGFHKMAHYILALCCGKRSHR